MYRFILFYFMLYICINVAPWSCEARHLVPLYVHTCSVMTIKLNLNLPLADGVEALYWALDPPPHALVTAPCKGINQRAIMFLLRSCNVRLLCKSPDVTNLSALRSSWALMAGGSYRTRAPSSNGSCRAFLSPARLSPRARRPNGPDQSNTSTSPHLPD